jgi:hypothetical protein
VLPSSRLDWARAMRAELDHLQDDREALIWAIGCVVAGSKERIGTMFAANLKISRWILALDGTFDDGESEAGLAAGGTLESDEGLEHSMPVRLGYSGSWPTWAADAK